LKRVIWVRNENYVPDTRGPPSMSKKPNFLPRAWSLLQTLVPPWVFFSFFLTRFPHRVDIRNKSNRISISWAMTKSRRQMVAGFISKYASVLDQSLYCLSLIDAMKR
jgi:hypothetical protein